MIEKIEKILAMGRAAVLCLDRRQRNSLFAAMKNANVSEGGILRFSFPENPDRFPMFANGALNAVATEASAQYCSRYPGTLVIEIDEESYVKTDMPMAFLELMSKLTRMRLVIVCGSEALMYHMVECASQFIVPGVIEAPQAEPDSAWLLESTAAKLGLRFADHYALRRAARLFDQYSAMSIFHTDTFLRSIVGSEGVISSASIRSEINAADSYVHACSKFLERYGMRTPARDRRIGFLGGECREIEPMNERSA